MAAVSNAVRVAMGDSADVALAAAGDRLAYDRLSLLHANKVHYISTWEVYESYTAHQEEDMSRCNAHVFYLEWHCNDDELHHDLRRIRCGAPLLSRVNAGRVAPRRGAEAPE